MKTIVKSILSSLLFVLPLSLFSQDEGGTSDKKIGVGFRFGDPVGLTIKTYGSSSQWEFNIGRTYSTSWKRYGYDDNFYRLAKYDKDDYIFKKYESHLAPLSLQIHYLRSKAIEVIDRLDFYYGFGLQVRMGRIEYWYLEKATGVSHNKVYSDIDLGIDGIFGLEYTFEEIPMSIFLDVMMFMEVYDYPFYFWPQGGIGMRYNW